MAVENGVGRIIIDGVDELTLIEEACRQSGKRVEALLRISPGVDSHTHQFITTGNVDSKFGIPLHGGIFEEAFLKINASEHIDLLGFHFHIGSQLHDNEAYLQAVGVLLQIIEDMHGKYGFRTSEINIGGGFGVRYTDEDDVKPYSYFLDPIMEEIQEWSARTEDGSVLGAGTAVRIVRQDGLTLYVEPAEAAPTQEPQRGCGGKDQARVRRKACRFEELSTGTRIASSPGPDPCPRNGDRCVPAVSTI